MPDKPVLHGRDHRPGGQDPSSPGAWIYVSNSSAPAWDPGAAYSPGDIVGDGTYNYVCILANKAGDYNPGSAQSWPTFWAISESVFQNGWDNQGSSFQDMRFRIVVGHYNTIDRETGNVSTYSDHQLEIQGSVTGGDVGSVIFVLPPAYDPKKDLVLPAANSAGDFVSYQVEQSGNVTLLTETAASGAIMPYGTVSLNSWSWPVGNTAVDWTGATITTTDPSVIKNTIGDSVTTPLSLMGAGIYICYGSIGPWDPAWGDQAILAGLGGSIGGLSFGSDFVANQFPVVTPLGGVAGMSVLKGAIYPTPYPGGAPMAMEVNQGSGASRNVTAYLSVMRLTPNGVGI